MKSCSCKSKGPRIVNLDLAQDPACSCTVEPLVYNPGTVWTPPLHYGASTGPAPALLSLRLSLLLPTHLRWLKSEDHTKVVDSKLNSVMCVIYGAIRTKCQRTKWCLPALSGLSST
ncbi:hypothetical protein J6590_011512 [Homalodisca vitripennis]|nr:hypothetical protein J6590_011512 [Homalodisca vitripennis]